MAIPVLGAYLLTDADSDTVSINRVTGISVGDLLVIIISTDINSDTSGFLSVPSGWTQEYELSVIGVESQSAVYSRIADGTESATETISLDSANNAWVSVYMRISGAIGIDVIGVSDDNTSNEASNTPPSITTTDNDSLILASYSMVKSGGTPITTVTSGWTMVFSEENAQKSTILAVAEKDQVVAGATGDMTFDSAASHRSQGIQFSISPSLTSTGAIMMGANF